MCQYFDLNIECKYLVLNKLLICVCYLIFFYSLHFKTLAFPTSGKKQIMAIYYVVFLPSDLTSETDTWRWNKTLAVLENIRVKQPTVNMWTWHRRLNVHYCPLVVGLTHSSEIQGSNPRPSSVEFTCTVLHFRCLRAFSLGTPACSHILKTRMLGSLKTKLSKVVNMSVNEWLFLDVCPSHPPLTPKSSDDNEDKHNRKWMDEKMS